MKNVTPKEKLDVDIRFLLANERTLLAWVRTALALMAGGIALTQFGPRTSQKTVVGSLIIFCAIYMSLMGYKRYNEADRAMRSGSLPDIHNGPKFQVMAVAIFGLALIAIEISLL